MVLSLCMMLSVFLVLWSLFDQLLLCVLYATDLFRSNFYEQSLMSGGQSKLYTCLPSLFLLWHGGFRLQGLLPMLLLLLES